MLERRENRGMWPIARKLGRPVSTVSRETLCAAIYAQPRGALKQG